MINRRDFLKMIGVGAGSILAGSGVARALASPELPEVLRAPSSAELRDPAVHILNRLAFGARPGQAAAVRAMGIDKYIEQQLAPELIDDSASEARLGDLITLDMMPAEMLAIGKQPREIAAELVAATIMRAIYSERQLLEMMTNFWSEHFSIYHHKTTCTILKTPDDRDVIRKNALGKFRDLLGASAKSPAMLIYLDNAESLKEHPNENYARELMELHTITIGNYTEDDVKQVARAFTGWTVRRGTGEFLFAPQIHDDAPKTVLGQTLPGNGIQDGEAVLDILAAHPNTAKHIASKLSRRFIADDPPESIVNAVADTYLKTGGDIKSMLRTIFGSQEFLNAPPKFKRPFEYLVSLFRALNVQQSGQITNIIAGINAKQQARPSAGLLLKAMGHLPFDWPSPDGYSDYAEIWIGDMLTRWNTAVLIGYGVIRGTTVDLVKTAGEQGADLTGRGVVDYFATHLLGRALTQAESDAIWGYANQFGEIELANKNGRRALSETVSLIAASPAFQYR